MNILRLIILTAIGMTMFQMEYAAEILLTIMGGFAIIYYWIIFNVVSGIKAIVVGNKSSAELHDSTMSIATSTIGVCAISIATPYTSVALVMSPWIVISLVSIIFAWLVHFDIFEMTNVDKNEDE